MMNRKNRSLIPCIAFLAAVAPIVAFDSERQTRVEVPGTSLQMVPPPGFESAASFKGFQHLSGSTIHVVEMDGPYTEIVGFNEDADRMKSRGMRLLSAELQPMGDLDGKLLRFSQETNGLRVEKWIWIFGTDQRTVMVVAQCPSNLAEAQLDSLKVAVLTTMWNPDQQVDLLEGLPFRLEDAGGLKLFSANMTNVVYSPSGQVDETGLEPLFVCGPSQGLYEGDPAEFAIQRLRQTRYHTRFKVTHIQPIEIDGLDGFELRASAMDTENDASKAIYQVVLYEGLSYWLIQGIVVAAQREQYIPVFTRMAKSFRRKQITIQSTGGNAELVVPSTWSTRSEIVEDAELSAFHIAGQIGVFLFSHPKSDFGSFEEFVENASGGMFGSSQPSFTLQIPKLDGEAHVFDTKDEGDFYRLALVEGRDFFFVIAFTGPGHVAESAKPDFDRVLKSFREIR